MIRDNHLREINYISNILPPAGKKAGYAKLFIAKENFPRKELSK
jgi:hypothetical protein